MAKGECWGGLCSMDSRAQNCSWDNMWNGGSITSYLGEQPTSLWFEWISNAAILPEHPDIRLYQWFSTGGDFVLLYYLSGHLEKSRDNFGCLILVRGQRCVLLAPSGWKPGMHSLVPQERIIQPQMSAELRWKNPGLDRQKGTSRQATLPDCRGTLNVSHSLCLRFLPLAKRGEMVSGFQSRAIPGRETHSVVTGRWESHFNFLSLSFFICQMKITIVMVWLPCGIWPSGSNKNSIHVCCHDYPRTKHPRLENVWVEYIANLNLLPELT